MKKLIIITSAFLLYINCAAQTGDMIVMKKNGQTVKTFMKGLYANFTSVTGQWVRAQVHDVKNDSIYFKEIIVRQVPTPWGVSRMDTMATLIRGMHYTDIYSIPKRWESFSYIRNGTMFMIGGAGYVALNVANSAIAGEPLFAKENIPRLAGGAAAFGVGKLLQKLHSKEMVVGKKYTLHYIKL